MDRSTSAERSVHDSIDLVPRRVHLIGFDSKIPPIGAASASYVVVLSKVLVRVLAQYVANVRVDIRFERPVERGAGDGPLPTCVLVAKICATPITFSGWIDLDTFVWSSYDAYELSLGVLVSTNDACSQRNMLWARPLAARSCSDAP
jgi:hypothetical protein